MSSLVKAGRVIRTAQEPEEVFVLGETVRASIAAPAPIARAAELIRSAEEMVEQARRSGHEIVAEAEHRAGEVRAAAYGDGYEAGRAAALDELAACLEVARRVAAEGKAIRDEIAEQAAGVVARATALATRKIVGEYYEADPARTAAACAEALRAAAAQNVLSVRVHPGLAEQVQAVLVDAARYVRPDEAVEIGGCIIDLEHGTIDASLEARLSLMELALREAGGEGDGA